MTQVVTADIARLKASEEGRMMSSLAAVKVWLWTSALATAAGWSLSVLGQLNWVGYLVFGTVVVALFLVARKAFGWELPVIGFNWRKLRRQFRRWLPASFAVLTFLVFLGGALYPPSNHAAFTYRTPRVLHWLMEGHWHWIYTPDYRMNDRACGFEWLTAPLLLFTKSDRGLFLINFISFLLLPGLIFSVFTRLGMRRRVAWHWMWLLPTGYNFLLQAGSTANDTFPTVYALAAMDFGLRAWTSRRVSDLWLSVLAAALLTGAKASNLTLLLPWAIVVCPLLPLLLRKPLATAGLAVLAATVSFLPSAALNQHYCGDWSGLKLEREGMNMKNPVVGVWGNALLLLKNFVPPFFPLAGKWNQSALTALPHAIVGPMVANFEQGFHMIGEMPTEDGAGIGFGLSVLIAVSVAAGLRRKERGRQGSAGFQPAVSRIANPQGSGPASGSPTGTWRYSGLDTCATNRGVPKLVRRLALIAPWGSLLAYGMKSGIVDAPRLISPYYALLLPSLLIGARQGDIVRRRWWRAMVWGVLLLAIPVVMTIPGRPLWPAQTVLSRLLARKPGQRSVARALEVYKVYGDRWDSLAQARALLPKGLTVVGFLGHGDDVDISLWRPFFSRRVKHILLENTPEQIRERHIQYAVVSGGYLATSGVPLATWLQRTRAELLGTVTVTQTVIHGLQPWYVVRFKMTNDE
jgi:hypothetical protein